MSTKELTLDAFRDVPDEIQTPTRTTPRAWDTNWSTLERCVRRVSEFEDLTGHTGIFTERQRENDARVVNDTVNQDIQRATMDGHDYSDMGGDQA